VECTGVHMFRAPVDAGDAMNAEQIRERVRRQPFQPFAIHLSNGEVHQVRHPECSLFGGGTMAIDDRERDCFAICALIHVNGVQFLKAA
jgi:predicted NodU family carbamoyl transferase